MQIAIILGGCFLFLLLAVGGIVFYTAMHSRAFEDRELQKLRDAEDHATRYGDLMSMIEAGDYYQEGRVTKADYRKALEWYQMGVDKFRSPQAMDRIGHIYLEGGNGVPQNMALARQWFEKGAAAGGSEAMRSLADIYFRGLGVDSDYQLAKQWEKKADDTRGRELAAKEIPKLEKASATGDVAAMNQLGKYYYDGGMVPKDYDRARQWWEKAAAAGGKGSVEAMNHLGELYTSDRYGLKDDPQTARGWYEKAAAAGSRDAMCSLAKLYGWEYPTVFPLPMRDNQKAQYWHDKCTAPPGASEER